MDVRTLNPLHAILATEGKHMGDLVRWELSDGVPQEKARLAAERLGLDNDLGFPVVTPNSAYRHAVRQAVRGGKSDERRWQIIKVEESPSRIVHAIVEKTVGYKTTGSSMTNRDASFATETRVGFDKDLYFAKGNTASMLVIEDEAHPISIRVRQLYDQLCVVYRADDIRTAFQRAFRLWAAMPIGNTGGLWWVPSTNADRVRDWAEFMEELGYRPFVIPLFDAAETINSLRRITMESVEGQMHDLMEEMASFAGKATTRMSTLEKRVGEFDSLRDRAELYESLLGHRMDAIKGQLGAAQKALVESIAAINETPEQAAQDDEADEDEEVL